MSEDVLYGCPSCSAIFIEPEFRRLEAELEEYWFCPNCGSPAAELGIAPRTTDPSPGLYYLTDGVNMTGPYDSAEEAQADLWSWFGGKDAYETGQGRKLGRLQEDSEEDEYEEEGC